MEAVDVAVRKILGLVKAFYPSWTGLADSRFVKDEITYKREACRKARELLGQEEYRRLLDTGEFEDIRTRLRSLANSTNLLYRSQPQTSDIAIIARDDLDFPAFARAFYELLFGQGDSRERLSRYLEFVTSGGYPNRWPFPTYFLFLFHPDTEFFVKPEVTQAFLKLAGEPFKYVSHPDAEWYGKLQDLLAALRNGLRAEGVDCTDMMELQSLIWVAVNENKKRFWKIAPGPKGVYWDEWREKGIASIGWDEMGDLSDLKDRAEFDSLVQICKEAYYPGDSEGAFNQVWKFVKEISIGDRIVANQGKSVVLGLGTVTGKYRFDRTLTYPHVVDVTWDDLKPRVVTQGGWVRTMVELDREKFETIQACPYTPETERPVPEARIFESNYPDEDERRLVCELLADAVVKAHGLNPKIWGVTFRFGKVRFNVGRITAMECRPESVLVSMLKDEVPEDILLDWTEYTNTDFQSNSFQEPMACFDLPVHVVEENRELISKLVGNFVAHAVQEMQKAPYSSSYRDGIVQYLRWFLARKLPDPDRRSPSDFPELQESQDSSEPQDFLAPVESRLFSEETFKYLGELAENPTREFYLAHKDSIQRFVEEPVQELLKGVGANLPEGMLDRLETEKNIFSRILKNDYGRGGAWAHYWGAFFPKGGKRVTGCQLFVSLDQKGLKVGLFFGSQSGEQEKCFLANLKRYGSGLLQFLDESWEERIQFFDERKEVVVHTPGTLKAWIKDPGHSPSGRAGLYWERDDLLELGREALILKVTQLFVDLFPLVLFALEENPMSAVLAWFDETDEPEREPQPQYPLEKISTKTNYPVETLQRWKRSILRKKQAVFYGPPGTGKTFVADHLARHLIGGGRGFSQVVQFHPSYAYEDFIEGIRPSVNGLECLVYTKERGVFLEFCRKAVEAGDDPCVLIVDEINRAPLSRVFGELMYLLEYRDQKIRLTSGREFAIPDNVYLIGTMNTADRSIALVDHALRRRFAFIPLFPEYGVLKAFHAGNGFDVSGLVGLLEEVNREIGDPNYSLGISFFMDENLDESIEDIWRMEIEPYLEEYFYDQNGKMEDFRWKKVGARILGPGA